MSGTADQTPTGEVPGETGGADDSAPATLTVDASVGGASDGVVDKFISPRTMILEAKSSEEEVPHPTRTKVQSRHKWIEQTLLKDQKPPAENRRKITARTRQSLPASASSGLPRGAAKARSSLGGDNDDVLARAREAIDGRKQSRVAAKAKVRAELALLGEDGDSSISLSTSSLKENDSDDSAGASAGYVASAKKEREASEQPMRCISEDGTQGDDADVRTKTMREMRAKATQDVEEIRAKAKERVDATMALLDASSGHITSSEDDVVENGLQTKTSEQGSVETVVRGLTKDSLSKYRKAGRAAAGRASQEPSPYAVAATAKQAPSESLAKLREIVKADPMARESALSKLRKKGEDKRNTVTLAELDRQIEAKQAELSKRSEQERAAERLEEERLASKAAEYAALQKQLEQENALADQRRKEKESRRLLEEERLASEALQKLKEQVEGEASDGQTDSDDGSTRLAITFDPIASCSTDTLALADRPSETTSDATSYGDLDSFLWQGKPRVDNAEVRLDDEDDIDEAISASFDESEYLRAESGATPDNFSDEEGGEMWKRAKEEAALSVALKNDLLPRDGPRGANELKPLSPSSHKDLTSKASKQSLPDEASSSYGDYGEEENVGWHEEGEEVVGVGSEWVGFKPNRMTALVTLGILGGLFPSLFAIMTCHFITGNVAVGEDEAEFGLHYGLHQFTPIDSAFQGYNQCQGYNPKYNYNPPNIPYAASIASIILGTIPLIVILAYLFFKMTHEVLWIGSMWMLYLAFVCQISTLSIFLLDGICGDNVRGHSVECSMGPGARATIMSSVMWFVLSMEMKVNSPLIQAVKSDGMVVIERDHVLISGMKKLWQRITGEAPSLSRTAMKKQKGRIGETEVASYRPPDIV